MYYIYFYRRQVQKDFLVTFLLKFLFILGLNLHTHQAFTNFLCPSKILCTFGIIIMSVYEIIRVIVPFNISYSPDIISSDAPIYR